MKEPKATTARASNGSLPVDAPDGAEFIIIPAEGGKLQDPGEVIMGAERRRKVISVTYGYTADRPTPPAPPAEPVAAKPLGIPNTKGATAKAKVPGKTANPVTGTRATGGKADKKGG